MIKFILKGTISYCLVSNRSANKLTTRALVNDKIVEMNLSHLLSSSREQKLLYLLATIAEFELFDVVGLPTHESIM